MSGLKTSGTFVGKSLGLIAQRLLKITCNIQLFHLQALRRQQQEGNQPWALSLCGGLGGKSVKSWDLTGQIMRLVQAISSVAQEVTPMLLDAQIPSLVFCWNKFLLSKDN